MAARRFLLVSFFVGLALAACNRPLAERLATAEPLPTVETLTATPAATPTLAASPTQALTSTPAPTPTLATGKTSTFEITSGGVQRTFLLYQPSTYQQGTPVPLVLNFHGLSSDAPGEQALSGMTPKAEAEGFIVVYPNGLNRAWRAGPASEDVQFTRDLITQLEVVYSIDPKRIYVTGMSNGGGMTNRIGCELTDVVAAIAPVSGAYNLWKVCPTARPMPVMAFHGLDDNVVPYNGVGAGNAEPPIPDWAQTWADRNGCNPTPTITNPDPTVQEKAWGSCSQNAEVVLYTLDHHGHSWPGSALFPAITNQAINATDLIWAFFQQHPLP